VIRVEVDAAVRALDDVDHIVVLMLENRSFDHVLGYLSLEGGRTDVDGLRRGLENRYRGKTYRPYRAGSTYLMKGQDPCHGGECVDEQLANGNGGFAANYLTTRTDPKVPKRPVVAMGYHTAAQLPVYDYLAKTYCVCDRWFCSVRGSTFPNRLYAVGGRAEGSRDNKKPPTYDVPAFVRELDKAGASWRWYTPELFPGIWAIDRSYLLKTIDNIRPFSSPVSRLDFFSAAQRGTLPAVAWIDPNFVDTGGPASSNDDHPPSDIRAGQELVLRVFNAVVRSPAWEKTLLVITYDEHGGFYDHVDPPPAHDDSPDPAFHFYGPRVPTIVVSPRLRSRVSHEVFDHTSIIKTLLVRFCRKAGQIPDMGARVSAAKHLGVLLGAAPKQAPGPRTLDRLAGALGDWPTKALQARLAAQAGAPIHPDPADLTDFQEDYLAGRDAVLASLTPRERKAIADSVVAMSLPPSG
jgi:phospholipase C